MKKLISIILCVFSILTLLFSIPEVLIGKPCMTVIRLSNGQSLLRINKDGGLRKLIDNAKLRNKKNSIPTTNDLQNIELKFMPNPIVNSGFLTFDLTKNSDVKIYSYDNNFIKREYFRGSMNGGGQELTIDLSDLNKGLVLMFVEVNGAVYVTRAIKI
ncbi:MAG: hypothetical protein RO257_01710 [Candidatus Kapabacteria bacterium]|nr:hypothetical protein [Candidatus Kapabacteria bacterium]